MPAGCRVPGRWHARGAARIPSAPRLNPTSLVLLCPAASAATSLQVSAPGDALQRASSLRRRRRCGSRCWFAAFWQTGAKPATSIPACSHAQAAVHLEPHRRPCCPPGAGPCRSHPKEPQLLPSSPPPPPPIWAAHAAGTLLACWPRWLTPCWFPAKRLQGIGGTQGLIVLAVLIGAVGVATLGVAGNTGDTLQASGAAAGVCAGRAAGTQLWLQPCVHSWRWATLRGASPAAWPASLCVTQRCTCPLCSPVPTRSLWPGSRLRTACPPSLAAWQRACEASSVHQGTTQPLRLECGRCRPGGPLPHPRRKSHRRCSIFALTLASCFCHPPVLHAIFPGPHACQFSRHPEEM